MTLSDSYVRGVNGALASKRDLWGEEVLARPEGPTYENVKDYLKPLMLGGLTDSETHYVGFGQPDGSGSLEVALHEADGSRFYSSTPQDDNPRVVPNTLTVNVGSAGQERYGSCAGRLEEPRLPGGYPVLQTDYVDGDGFRYSQESFAARSAQVPQSGGHGNLVSWIRLSVERGASTASRVTLNFVAKTPGLFQSGNSLVGMTPFGLRTYLVFSPGATYDPASGSLTYPIDLSSGGPRSVYLVRLNQPNTLNAPIVPTADSYEAARSASKSYWDGRLGQGATFSVPEPRVAEAQRNLLIQNINMGKYYSLGNSYQFTYTEQYDAIRTLGEYGLPQQERALLEELMEWTQNGRQGYDGLFKGNKLLSAAAYYKRTRDKEFVDKYTPLFVQWVESFKAQIDADPNGLLKKELWSGDFGGPCYALSYNQSFGFAGLRDMVEVWSMSGRADLASKYGPLVTSFRRSLRAAIDRSKVRLADGSLFVPACLLEGVRPYEPITATIPGSYWNLVMQRPFSLGLFEPRSAETRAIGCYMSNHGSRLLGMIRFNMGPAGSPDLSALPGFRSSGTDPVYNYGLADFLAENDDPDQLVLTLYGLLAHGVSRGTYIGGEGETVGVVPGEYYRSMLNPPNSVTNAAILNTLRVMLVDESNASSGRADGLHLANSTPRRWLEPGKQIAVTNAPTEFGPVSYTLERSAADPLLVQAQVTIPPRLGNDKLSIRMRLPGGMRMSGVTLNGQPHTRFDAAAETVDLTGQSGQATLRVQYVEAPPGPSRATSTCQTSAPIPPRGTGARPPGGGPTHPAPRARGRCFPRRLRVGRRSIGALAVGAHRDAVLKRLGRPQVRRGSIWRYCVRGGRLLVVFSKSRRIILVASTVRGHTRHGIGPGTTVRRLRRVFRRVGVDTLPGTNLRPRKGSSRQVVFGTRQGRVRFVAVTDAPRLKKPSSILALERQIGLRPRRSRR